MRCTVSTSAGRAHEREDQCNTLAHGFVLEHQLHCLPPHPAVAACPLHNRCLQFCATGKGGFARNLLPHEIVDQVLTVQEEFGQVRRTGRGIEAVHSRCPLLAACADRSVLEGRQPTHICGSLLPSTLLPPPPLLNPPPPLQRVSNIVFMGMGEPLLNLPSVLRAHEILNKDIGIGERGGGSSCPCLPLAWGRHGTGRKAFILPQHGAVGARHTTIGPAWRLLTHVFTSWLPLLALPPPCIHRQGRATSPSARWVCPTPSAAWAASRCSPHWRSPSTPPARCVHTARHVLPPLALALVPWCRASV